VAVDNSDDFAWLYSTINWWRWMLE